MYKNIISVILGNKTEALLVVEPFQGPFAILKSPPFTLTNLHKEKTFRCDTIGIVLFKKIATCPSVNFWITCLMQ
ncbi:MAG: hypothetical protein CV087_03265 [Candidatus Brocadia sp. WS118]|nr:MAG: hypothetical protein CV087_03265 [Candidatus Brocadia sp. WS118]